MQLIGALGIEHCGLNVLFYYNGNKCHHVAQKKDAFIFVYSILLLDGWNIKCQKCLPSLTVMQLAWFCTKFPQISLLFFTMYHRYIKHVTSVAKPFQFQFQHLKHKN